ncbi:MAG: abortive infection family protein [Lamprobacter sp.]|uniref:abortive infection family protein n=1 Tax=Lamprobacter sp. TaxID=3100796 RepID=UPI002B261D03|nr:abortive infection family protein [Lamprobacter sp.]MEA3642030.1 abortive infection family protein [Lamprobacter sp.]
MAEENSNLRNAAVESTSAPRGVHVFQLPSAKIAIQRTPQAQRITQLIDAIEEIPASNGELVFDLCRALVESVCKTILNDLGEPLPSKPNAEKMVSALLKRLEVFLDPQSAEAESKKAVGDTVTGINKFVNGIGEYRRLFGAASHGRDGYSDVIDLSHANLVVGVTDALVAFLFETHRRLHGQEAWQRAQYGDHEDFDQYLDDEHDPSPIMVFGDEYQPSRAFFALNRSGYLKRLNDWRKMRESGEIDPEDLE